MSLKAKIEAIIYAAEEPVTLDQMLTVLGEDVEQALKEQQAALAASEPQPEQVTLDEAEPATESEAAEPPSETSAEQPEAADAATEAPAIAGKKKRTKSDDPKRAQRAFLRSAIDALAAEYEAGERGMEIREVAGGWRMTTKPEHHDVVRGFAKSLKPPVRLSLQALETLAVIAYKQPVTAPEISEIRGVDSSGVIATLIDRKLVTTAGRKQVIGRPILYKTTKDFLLRFGLKDVNELPSMEEFEKMSAVEQTADLFPAASSEPVQEPGAEEASPEQEPTPEPELAPAATVNPDQSAALPTEGEREPQ